LIEESFMAVQVALEFLENHPCKVVKHGVPDMSSTFTIVKPVGVLDATQTAQLRSQIDDAMQSGASTVLVDFEQVSFMDSSGLGALVGAFKSLRARGGKLYVCSINEQIRILFELTSMDRVFDIFPSQEEFSRRAFSGTSA
jgi:anti-sigma B factor antagonist